MYRLIIADLALPEEPPTHCERCGADDCLDKFQGWKHYGDEGEWLCRDCHVDARMEE